MKIVIAGLGGMGGIVGGKLALSDSENTVFFCRGETLRAVKSNGLELRLSSGAEKFTATPRIITDDVKDIGHVDAVFFAVKSYGLEEISKSLAPVIDEKTLVIPLLNGLMARDELKKYFPNSDVLGGCIYVSSFIVSPGIVQQNGDILQVLFGNPSLTQSENEKKYSPLAEIFKKAGIDTVLTCDIDTKMWIKFIMISSLATATSLYNRDVGGILADAQSSETLDGLIREISLVARKKGAALPDGVERATMEKIRTFTPQTKTSMQLDFERKGKTELESLVGYVCREAAKAGAAVPLYDDAYLRLK